MSTANPNRAYPTYSRVRWMCSWQKMNANGKKLWQVSNGRVLFLGIVSLKEMTMRYGHIQHGVIGIGHKENHDARWAIENLL